MRRMLFAVPLLCFALLSGAWTFQDCVAVNFNHPDCTKYQRPPAPPMLPPVVVPPAHPPVAPPSDAVEPCAGVTEYRESTQPGNQWLREPDCGFEPPALVPPVSITPVPPYTPDLVFPPPTIEMTATPPAFTPLPPRAGTGGYLADVHVTMLPRALVWMVLALVAYLAVVAMFIAGVSIIAVIRTVHGLGKSSRR